MAKILIKNVELNGAITDVLIENKVGNAVISLQTIRKAINSIASLKGQSLENIKNSFIQLFTKKPVGELTKSIQEGAYNKAVKSINELFKVWQKENFVI